MQYGHIGKRGQDLEVTECTFSVLIEGFDLNREQEGGISKETCSRNGSCPSVLSGLQFSPQGVLTSCQNCEKSLSREEAITMTDPRLPAPSIPSM